MMNIKKLRRIWLRTANISSVALLTFLFGIQIFFMVGCSPMHNPKRGAGAITRDSISRHYVRDAYRDSREKENWPIPCWLELVKDTDYSSEKVLSGLSQIQMSDSYSGSLKIMGDPFDSEIFSKKNRFIGTKALRISIYSKPKISHKGIQYYHLCAIVFLNNRVDKIICTNYSVRDMNNKDIIHHIKKYCYEEW
jgi:hypothetical protein